MVYCCIIGGMLFVYIWNAVVELWQLLLGPLWHQSDIQPTSLYMIGPYFVYYMKFGHNSRRCFSQKRLHLSYILLADYAMRVGIYTTRRQNNVTRYECLK